MSSKKAQTTVLPYANVPRLASRAVDDRPRVKLADIKGEEIVITGHETREGDNGPYLYVSLVRADGNEAVLMTSATVLTRDLKTVEEFPVRVRVGLIPTGSGRTCWVFEPDQDPFEEE